MNENRQKKTTNKNKQKYICLNIWKYYQVNFLLLKQNIIFIKLLYGEYVSFVLKTIYFK